MIIQKLLRLTYTPRLSDIKPKPLTKKGKLEEVFKKSPIVLPNGKEERDRAVYNYKKGAGVEETFRKSPLEFPNIEERQEEVLDDSNECAGLDKIFEKSGLKLSNREERLEDFSKEFNNVDPFKDLELNIHNKSNLHLVHKDFLKHSNFQRQGTVSTKTKSEVRGGGRKPWRQKGTGHARAGSNRSPLWKGGGVTFGPKPKTVAFKVNKKERKLVLQTLLYNRRKFFLLIDEKFVGKLYCKPRTKDFLLSCKNYGINFDQKLLVVVLKKTLELKLSTQNLKNVELISASSLNTYSILKAKRIILTPAAIDYIKDYIKET